MNFSHIRCPASIIKDHFYGWGFIIEKFKRQAKLVEGEPILDAWADGYHNEYQLDLLKRNKWVGILHGIASESREQNLNRFFSSAIYRKTKDNCLFLLTTSEHTRQHCQTKTSIPIKTLLHPKPDTGHRFEIDLYFTAPTLRHSGFFGRNIDRFINFNSNLTKLITCDRTAREKKYKKSLSDNDSIIFRNGFLEPDDYIELLTCTIGYAFYDDCSASTSILEHIMTHTPVLVNKIPPIVEYLGEDYPMYLDDLPDNIDKRLTDRAFIQEVSDYLAIRSTKKELSVEYFINFLNNL